MYNNFKDYLLKTNRTNFSKEEYEELCLEYGKEEVDRYLEPYQINAETQSGNYVGHFYEYKLKKDEK